MEKIRIIIGLTKNDVEFMSRMCQTFGNVVTGVSYRALGNRLGCSYENVRYHLERLEKSGLIAVEKISPYKRAYHLNMEAIKGLA